MSKLSRFFLHFTFISLLIGQSVHVWAGASPKAKSEEGVNGNLVTTQWLSRNLKNADILLLDASTDCAKNHIAGAVCATPYALMTFGEGAMPVSQTEEIYQKWGISPGKRLVIYDGGGSNVATTLFFSLYYRGYPATSLYILDGGLFKWQKDGFPITKDTTPEKRGTFKITKMVDEARAELPEVLTASGDTTKNTLVEGLTPDYHFGQFDFFGKGGHIPHGIMAPDVDFYNADKTFKSPAEVTQMLQYLGIRPEQQIYTYCGGGVAATVPYFAAKFIANYPKVKVFQESELGWVSDQRQLPFWTYDDPNMMRDIDWLKFRGGQMIRSVFDPHMTMVDIRSAADYNKGHVPFAVNIPAETFQADATDPGKLAAVLGPAGVHAADEAVVISGAGLTKEAALAYLMLEKLGQKDVTVLMSPGETWPAHGVQVTNKPTAVGPKKSPRDTSIVPMEYPANMRKEIMVADAANTKGAYPKVFIASGKDVPAKTQDGKTVHVAYTDLLNADGSPKAAMDIWNILTKAGVPRYAEIVCYSEDPGEAAANYYILKLMGFPDVKVLVL
jgi:thiosulfate/3-mercaptopyruvate sulfurtransferase